MYLGLESEDLKEALEKDGANGILTADDDRVLKGQLFAAGADAGFVLGGVLAVLSTYNFIRDPLPESSHKADKSVEFEDPLNRRPHTGGKAVSVHRPRHRDLMARRRDQAWRKPREPEERGSFQLGPRASGSGAGFFVGGSF